MKMMKKLMFIFCTFTFMFLVAGTANANHLEGMVYCDADGSGDITEDDTCLAGVKVKVVDDNGGVDDGDTFNIEVVTECPSIEHKHGDYNYWVVLSATAELTDTYIETVDLSGYPGAEVIIPEGGVYNFNSETHWWIKSDWLISSEACVQTTDCGGCEGKVTELTLKYNGVSTAYVEVFQKKVDGPVFNGNVGPGETFTFSGWDTNGTLGTEISIFVDYAINTQIHTSCSKPIGPGLVSGDFEVVEGYSRVGGLLCESSYDNGDDGKSNDDDDCCEGKVTELTLQYNGAVENAVIKVVQKKKKKKKKDGITVFSETVQPGEEFTFYGEDKKGTLGTEISIYVDDVLNTKIHTSCSKPIGPGLVSGDFEVVEGYSKGGGLLCETSYDNGDDGKSNDDDDCCEGKVTELTLQYNGNIIDAFIEVVQKKDDITVFSDTVQPDGSFTFNGLDKKGTLGTEISIYVDGVLNTEIHTSCSKPIGPGLVSGDFEVVEGYSRNGGKLCQLP